MKAILEGEIAPTDGGLIPAAMPARYTYQIRVKGHLADHWSRWFNGLQITNLENGEALLAGIPMDQSALHGVLNRIRDLNLVLISIKSFEGA